MLGPPADAAWLRALVYGGAVLGGGGGGSLDAGLASARAALRLGVPRIVPLARLDPAAVVATLSAVGSAGQMPGTALDEGHFGRAIDIFQPFAQCRIDGFIASEVGPQAVTYGLRESACTGVPVVDAPANGRAHPLFAMGSLGLHLRSSRTHTTVAVGGRKGSPTYIEMAVRTNVARAGRMVRDRAARDRIPLAVVRNPVPAAYLSEHAAVGGLEFAHRVGCVLLARLAYGPHAVLAALTALMGGRILAKGRVASADVSEQKGFTIGQVVIALGRGQGLAIAVCNEFIAVIDRGRSVATFPDLIALFDDETGLPLASTDATAGRPVAIFVVPRRRLILGSAMRDQGLMREAGRLAGVGLPS
jgi:DUF917 family protein